jgi:hypothetical protein
MSRPAEYQYWISYDDCIHDTVLDFTVSSTEGPVTMKASATAQCSATFVFQPGDPQTDNCYLISSAVQNGDTVHVGAQALVKGALGIDCTTSVTPPANETIVWPQPLTIYLYNSTDSAVWPSPGSGGLGGATSGTGTAPQFDIALVGPQPPSPISLGAGEDDLILQLPATPTDPNTQGYYAFCYPQPAFDGGTIVSSGSAGMGGTGGEEGVDGGAGDAGDEGGVDGGAGGAGGSSSGSDCPAGTMLPEVPSFGSKYLCAQIPAAATSFSIAKTADGAPLEDGVQYVVAVAAYDQVFNLGPLAPLQCATPQAVDSFFGVYCADGGPGCVGGCGSCDVGGGADPVWPALGAGVIVVAGIVVRRDRRRRA